MRVSGNRHEAIVAFEIHSSSVFTTIEDGSAELTGILIKLDGGRSSACLQSVRKEYLVGEKQEEKPTERNSFDTGSNTATRIWGGRVRKGLATVALISLF